MRFKILRHGGYGATGLATTGGNMSGPLVLVGSPTQPLEASTKGYVDTALGNLNGASLITGLIPVERLPAFTGDIVNVAGSNSFALTDAGITPGSYPRVTVNAKGRITNGFLLTEADLPALDWGKVTAGKPTTMAGYGITDAINPSGGVMTGTLTVNNDPTAPLHVATKGYIDNLNAGSAGGSLKTGDLVRKVTSVTPTGFLRCNGSQVSKTTYSALYAIVGDTYSLAAVTLQGSGAPWINQYDFNTTQTAVLGGWTTEAPFPTNTFAGAVLMTKNYAYIIAGIHGQSVYRAPIDAGGNLGVWTDTGAFPIPLIRASVVVTKNRVFVLGGTTFGAGNAYNTANNAVYTAIINADGTLGAWTTNTSLPIVMNAPVAFITTDRLYVTDGNSNVYASVNTDGTLGSWVTGTQFTLTNGSTFSLSYGGVCITKNRIFVLGNNSANIYSCPILADGTLGTWSASTAPKNVYDSQAIVVRNKIYLIAGYGDATVFSATVNADGTLGTWSQGNSLPVDLQAARLVATSTKLYMIGGYSNGLSAYQSTIYSVPFTGGVNDYSNFYNGTITATNGTNATNFALPDLSGKEMPGSYTYMKY